MNEQPKIGLALGGGAVLGAAHVGVLKALDEKGVKVDYIAGTSIGAMVGAFFAFGKSWKEIEDVALHLKWIDIAGFTLSKYGLLTNEKMENIIEDHIGKKKIEDAEIPLLMVATDISSGEKVQITKGPLAAGVMASTCIPGIFKPVDLNGRMLVDGGILENVPISSVKSLGAEYVIGVDLNAENSYKKPGNILDVIVNSFHFTLQATAKLQTEAADLLIAPNLSEYNASSIKHVKELMERGYEDAKKVLDNWEVPVSN